MLISTYFNIVRSFSSILRLPGNHPTAILQFLYGVSGALQGSFFLKKKLLGDEASLYINWRTAIAHGTSECAR